MEHIDTRANPNICLSGGAYGADLEWGHSARAAGHKVIHWSFPSARTSALPDEIIQISDAELSRSAVTEAVHAAAQAINKSPPKQKHVWRLIHRNYYQVAWSTSCYAVTFIRPGVPPGGTAWATEMFTHLHPESDKLYLFDQETECWLQCIEGKWVQIVEPPRPSGVWAGIGSRDLRLSGKEAIRRLMAEDK